MERKVRATDLLPHILDAIVETSFLIDCPRCATQLAKVDPDDGIEVCARYPAYRTETNSIHQMMCQPCAMIWRLTVTLACRDGAWLTMINLDGYDLTDRYRQIAQFAHHCQHDDDLMPESTHWPQPTDPAAPMPVTIEASLPAPVRNLGPSSLCLSQFQAALYVAHAVLREYDPQFVGHVGACDYCIRLLTAAQKRGTIMCPTRDVLAFAQTQSLPQPLQALVLFHVWDDAGSCRTCQEHWATLILSEK
ncbi:hypothetical protein HY523_02100 [Candidatus Berkelbacteria bacterium]|nr:hypothetical protein [Candidatus Berkelbacteria bacterium]